MPVGDLFEGEAEVFQGLGVSITPFKLTKVAETLCIPFLETVNRIVDSTVDINHIYAVQIPANLSQELMFFSAVLTFCTVSLNWHMRVRYFNRPYKYCAPSFACIMIFCCTKTRQSDLGAAYIYSVLILAKFFICSIIATRTRNDFMSQNCSPVEKSLKNKFSYNLLSFQT